MEEMRVAKQKRIEREEIRQEEQLKREERMLISLREAQPVVPQMVTLQNQTLLKMTEQEEVETFVAMFEAALRTKKVPELQWKAKLHSHLNPKAKLRIQSVILDHDSTYEQVKDALLRCSNKTFNAAVKSLMSREWGRIYTLDHRRPLLL